MIDQINAASQPAVGGKSALAKELVRRHLAGKQPKSIKVKMEFPVRKSASNQYSADSLGDSGLD